MQRRGESGRRVFRREIIALTTDFGTRDSYVGEMKGAILARCCQATIVDVTHDIPRHDIGAGAFVLERALGAFCAGTVHVVVVDPGVGTKRKILLCEINGQFVICPDNGLITWAMVRLGGKAWELTWRPGKASRTFHGRDIMAPVAALLAEGVHPSEVAKPAKEIVELETITKIQEKGRAVSGRVIYVDVYGNCITNVGEELLSGRGEVKVGKRKIGLGTGENSRGAYGEVKRGEVLALVGSAGLLEIAVREGSAARKLGIRVGDRVELR